MNFAEEYLAHYTAEIAASKERIGRQAADRARANGIDPDKATAAAIDLWTPGAAHEPIISNVAGEYRRSA